MKSSQILTKQMFHFILTISLDKRQTKSFGMNTLLLAILKFCTINQPLKYPLKTKLFLFSHLRFFCENSMVFDLNAYSNETESFCYHLFELFKISKFTRNLLIFCGKTTNKSTINIRCYNVQFFWINTKF